MPLKKHIPAAINTEHKDEGHCTAADASVFFGKIQMYGRVSDKDKSLGIIHFKNALKQHDRHHPEALYQIGVAAMEGRGIPVDYDRALRFLMRAHQNGHDAALTKIRVLNQNLLFVMQNTISQENVHSDVSLKEISKKIEAILSKLDARGQSTLSPHIIKQSNDRAAR